MKLLQNTSAPETYNSVLWNVDTSYPTDEASSFLKLLVVVAIEAEQSFQALKQ